MRRRIVNGLWLLLLVALSLDGAAQRDTTKSGTAVSARVRERAVAAVAAKGYEDDGSRGVYMAVTRRDLLPALQPLLRWKRQQGYRVEVMVSDTHQRDSIRRRLMERYVGATPLLPAPRYVLIVGDVDRIQAFVGQHTPEGLNNSVTDLYYGEYTGDYIPEALVGRLSVGDSSELAAVVAKIIAYERGDWDNAYRQLLLVAGSESRDPAPRLTNGQVHRLAALAAEVLPAWDTACFYNPASDSLRESLTDTLGAANAWVGYTAHCSRSGWVSPTVRYADIDSIDNALPAVWVNNCCLSNAYDGTCFGEQLLRRPRGGGAAVVGATNETLWEEDYYWAVGAQHPGAYQRAWGDGAATLGEMNYAGCRAVTLSGSRYDAYYWETYTLLGDPAMVPCHGAADSLTVALADTLWQGTTRLTVYTQPGAYVAVTADSLLLGVAQADSQGVARLNVCPAITAERVTLTATRPGSIACQREVAVTAPQQAWIAPTRLQWRGDALEITLRNTGRADAVGHSRLLLPDSLAAVLTLGAGEDTLIRCVPHIQPAEYPRCSGVLLIGDSGTYGRSTFALALPDRAPQVAALRLLAAEDGHAVTYFLPGHSYRLEVTLEGVADSLLAVVGGEGFAACGTGGSFAFTAPMDDAHLAFTLTSRRGYGRREWSGYLLPYRAYERFESGGFDSYPWRNSEACPWSIDSTEVHAGRYSARSGATGDGQRSTLTLELEVLADDSLAFHYNVSSEGSDWFLLYVDGRKRYYASGNSGWQRAALPIAAGTHRIEFIYQKDASGSERDDCVRIDDLRLPLCRWDRPCGEVEADTTLAINCREWRPFRLYPNPARGEVTIQSATDEPATLWIYDASGRRVDALRLPGGGVAVRYSTQHLRAGVYTLVQERGGASGVVRLVIPGE